MLVFLSSSLDGTLFYSKITMSLCIRRGLKITDLFSKCVEELDWSAESKAETLWCD